MRNVSFSCLRINILHIFLRKFLMLFQIKICSICQSLQLSPSSWVSIFDVSSASRVMRKFILLMVSKSQIIRRKFQILIPKFLTSRFPFLKHLLSNRRIIFYKVLNLHLFKFTCSIQKVTWCNFITKCFTNLSNTKRNT